MSRKIKATVLAVLAVFGLVIIVIYLNAQQIDVLSPSGPIASKERNLIFLVVGLSMIVVIPVFFMLIWFAYRYREGNKNSVYQPDFDHNRLIEGIWWGVPLLIIIILGTVTWKSSHELDPFKPLTNQKTPLTIQVIALQWKWLFIYPNQQIASVNYVQFPENTPLNFQITSDAPMNSFWIPKLGGQIYAMSGMATNLHLMASEKGFFRGSSANISGKGFASMDFLAHSTSKADFEVWAKNLKQSWPTFDPQSYQKLSKQGTAEVAFYSLSAPNLFSDVVQKYNHPAYALQPSLINQEAH